MILKYYYFTVPICILIERYNYLCEIMVISLETWLTQNLEYVRKRSEIGIVKFVTLATTVVVFGFSFNLQHRKKLSPIFIYLCKRWNTRRLSTCLDNSQKVVSFKETDRIEDLRIFKTSFTKNSRPQTNRLSWSISVSNFRLHFPLPIIKLRAAGGTSFATSQLQYVLLSK